MNNLTTAHILQIAFGLAAVLCGFVFASVVVGASMKPSSRQKRSRYVFLGGSFAFVSCVSASAFMLVDTPDVRALLMLLIFSVGGGLAGAFFVFYSQWSSTWWGRYLNRLTGGNAKEDE